MAHVLSIVIPAYNEEEAIGGVLAALREHAPAFDVLVIDDGSRDNTAAVVRAAGLAVGRVTFPAPFPMFSKICLAISWAAAAVAAGVRGRSAALTCAITCG